MNKVVPSERLRRELDDVLAGIGEEQDPIEAVARRGARLILQQALEDEVTEFVGRGRCEPAGGGEGVMYRNGFAEPSTVRTTSGPTVIERPRVRNVTAVGFESQVLGKGVARTHAVEALVVCGFLRGLSVRDVEAALEECFGEQVVSKSTVARVCKDVAARYAAWWERDLGEHDLVYCYLDAI
jgi:putative transposase